jgi:CBS domain-containing protein
MTKRIITVHEDDTTREIAATFDKNHIHGAPVVDDMGKMVGIVSESDLIKAAARSANAEKKAEKIDAKFKPRSDLQGSQTGSFITPGGFIALLRYKLGSSRDVEKDDDEADSFRGDRAEDIMLKEVVTVGPDEPLKKAVQIMKRKGINRLPVVNKDGEPIGMITRADVIKALANELGAA